MPFSKIENNKQKQNNNKKLIKIKREILLEETK